MFGSGGGIGYGGAEGARPPPYDGYPYPFGYGYRVPAFEGAYRIVSTSEDPVAEDRKRKRTEQQRQRRAEVRDLRDKVPELRGRVAELEKELNEEKKKYQQLLMQANRCGCKRVGVERGEGKEEDIMTWEGVMEENRRLRKTLAEISAQRYLTEIASQAERFRARGTCVVGERDQQEEEEEGDSQGDDCAVCREGGEGLVTAGCGCSARFHPECLGAGLPIDGRGRQVRTMDRRTCPQCKAVLKQN